MPATRVVGGAEHRPASFGLRNQTGQSGNLPGTRPENLNRQTGRATLLSTQTAPGTGTRISRIPGAAADHVGQPGTFVRPDLRAGADPAWSIRLRGAWSQCPGNPGLDRCRPHLCNPLARPMPPVASWPVPGGRREIVRTAWYRRCYP